jgi:hypothetical protein
MNEIISLSLFQFRFQFGDELLVVIVLPHWVKVGIFLDVLHIFESAGPGLAEPFD